MLKLLLSRDTATPTSTEGVLTFEDSPLPPGVPSDLALQTLELPVRDGLPGSAIPKGIYPVVLAPSPKFMAMDDDLWVRKYARLMPHIIQIPNRTEIMIHFGNDPEETSGCVLVGMNRGVDWIGSSRAAFELLWRIIEIPAQNGNCEIEIVGSDV